jgi:hypothetical protein
MAREEVQTPTPVAQITICGVLNAGHVATLVEVAMAAGAGLIVQPRALAESVAAAIVQAAPRLNALPPARKEKREASVRKASVSGPVSPLVERARRALADGPLPAAEFREATGFVRRDIERLIGEGAIVASGVTRGRRYALPGHRAKEAL